MKTKLHTTSMVAEYSWIHREEPVYKDGDGTLVSLVFNNLQSLYPSYLVFIAFSTNCFERAKPNIDIGFVLVSAHIY